MKETTQNFEYHSLELKFLYLLEKIHKNKIKLIPSLKKHFLIVGDIGTQDKLLQNYIKDFKWNDDLTVDKIPSIQLKSLFREATNISIGYSNSEPHEIKNVDGLGLVINSSLNKENTINFIKKYLDQYKEKIVIFLENSSENNLLANEIEELIKESNRSDISIHPTNCKKKEGVKEAFESLVGDLSLAELKEVTHNLEETLSQTMKGFGILLIGEDHQRIINLISKISPKGALLNPPSAVKESKYKNHKMEYLIYADPELNATASTSTIDFSLEAANGVAILIDASKSLEENQKYLDQYLFSEAIKRNSFIPHNKIIIFYDTHKGNNTSEAQIKEYLQKNKFGGIEIEHLPSDPTQSLNNNCDKLLLNFCKEMSPSLTELNQLLFRAETFLLKKTYDLKQKGLNRPTQHSNKEPSNILNSSKQYKSLFHAYFCIEDLKNIVNTVELTLGEREKLCVKFLKSKRKVLLEENFLVSLYYWIISFFQSENKYLNNYLKKYDQKLNKDSNEFELSKKTDKELQKNDASSLKNNPNSLFKKGPDMDNNLSTENNELGVKHN